MRPDRILNLDDLDDGLTLADAEVVLVRHGGAFVEVRRKPRYRWQHAHLGLWGLLTGRAFSERWNTIALNWRPVRHVGQRVRHTLYLKLSGEISARGLRHEFAHVEQLARYGSSGYAARYATPRGRLGIEAEANAELVVRQRQQLAHEAFRRWLNEKAAGMRRGYYLWLLTFRGVTDAEIKAALLDAAGIEHTDGEPAERRLDLVRADE